MTLKVPAVQTGWFSLSLLSAWKVAFDVALGPPSLLYPSAFQIPIFLFFIFVLFPSCPCVSLCLYVHLFLSCRIVGLWEKANIDGVFPLPS